MKKFVLVRFINLFSFFVVQTSLCTN